MSRADQLIEKLGLAVHGETPEVVIEVLAAFARELCERYGTPVEVFVEKFRGAGPAVPPAALSRRS